MVYSGQTGRGRVRELVMAMEPERSKPPLHNFNLPYLKWGNQRYLRCMKVSDSATVKDKNISNGVSGDRLRSSRSPLHKFFPTPDYEIRPFKRAKSRNGGGGGLEQGIAEVREKLMFDFKAAADKMKDEILRKRVSEDGGHLEEEEEEEEVDEKVQSSPRAPPAVAAVDTEEEVRPWNLRTRRAACKAPIAGNSVREKSGLKNDESNYSPLRTDSAKSPRLRGVKKGREDENEKDTEQARTKFAVSLSRKEIEEDFMEMVGHRPARRPKKRPRNVQRQLDSLFPGLWLTEITVDTYKVPEFPDNGKR